MYKMNETADSWICDACNGEYDDHSAEYNVDKHFEFGKVVCSHCIDDFLYYMHKIKRL